jgi:hypothetical protein
MSPLAAFAGVWHVDIDNASGIEDGANGRYQIVQRSKSANGAHYTSLARSPKYASSPFANPIRPSYRAVLESTQGGL